MKIFVWFAAPLLCAQSFEVASIKPHPGEVTISADPLPRGNRVIGTATTLVDMITGAYGVRYDQVSGGPEWVKTDRFDVDAKGPGEAAITRDQAKLMMRKLLAERFQLVLHREQRDVPAYALVVGPSGVKFRPSAPETSAGGFVRGNASGNHMEAKKGTMVRLAEQLSLTAGRPVIDRTGLTGAYDYTLDWFPANRIPPENSQVPSMFAALQEQLGLRLEAITAPQEHWVIDRAEKPSGN